jgi:hypothetical protein
MALGKSNPRIRSHMGDNGHFKFGDPAAWEQFGKSNRWKLTYSLGSKESEMADQSVVNMTAVRKATLEIDLAQSHPEEMALVDSLKNSDTIEFWGDCGTIGNDKCELYIKELIMSGDVDLETPASDNIKLKFSLKIQPQADVYDVQDTDLPTASVHGGTPVESKNEFFNYFVAIED